MGEVNNQRHLFNGNLSWKSELIGYHEAELDIHLHEEEKPDRVVRCLRQLPLFEDTRHLDQCLQDPPIYVFEDTYYTTWQILERTRA